jgi:hypothetical protein
LGIEAVRGYVTMLSQCVVTSIAVFPRRLSRARITKPVSQLLNYVDGPEMKFCDLRPFIAPRTINDKVLHEPRSGWMVRYLGDAEMRKRVTRLHFAIPVKSDVFAHRQGISAGIG